MAPRILLCVALCTFSLLGTACAPRVATVETGPDAEITHDGLHRVDHSRRFQRIWVKPDIDLDTYTKILPVDAGIHYKRAPRKSRGEWPLDESQMNLVKQGLRDAMQKELERQGEWEFVTERGPDVLVIRGAIIDLVVTAPSRDTGRNRSYSSSIGQATLVLELFDSESLEILARIADRRAITHNETSWRNDPASNRAAAQRTFREWARRLSQGLTYVKTVGFPLPTSETPGES